MAFFTVNGEQCRVQWPNGIGIVDPRPEDVPHWRALPVEYEELCERISLEGFGQLSRRVVFQHPELESHDAVDFALRLQGVVADVNINAMGNWTGDVEGAPKAMQWLNIVAGGYAAAFKPQKYGVNNLEEVVRNMLNVQQSTSHPRDGSIKLQRRVFTKVIPGVEHTSITFGRHEDADGRAANIAHEWIVDHRIKTGSMEGSKFMPKHTLSIRRGDLVDVLVTVEIVNMRGRHGRRTEVYFCPQEVVKLESARNLNSLKKQGGSVKDTRTSTAVPAGTQRDKFGFGVEGGSSRVVVPMETAD